MRREMVAVLEGRFLLSRRVLPAAIDPSPFVFDLFFFFSFSLALFVLERTRPSG